MSDRSLLLDAEGTLMHLAEPAHRVYARVAAQHGIACDEARLERRLPDSIARRGLPVRDGVPLARVPELERESWRSVIRELLGDEAADGLFFAELFALYGEAGAWRLAPGAPGALGAARSAGWRLAVVSNMDARLPGILAGLDVTSLLDAAVFPASCGLAKPDPRIFRHALEQLGTTERGALYVGDRERDCLEGARRAGLRVLRYDPGADPADPGALPAWTELETRLRALE